MDILIRIVLMLVSGVAIPFIAKFLYEPMNNFRKQKKSSQIKILILYFLFFNWFIIAPAIIFIECFKYLINTI